MKTDKSALMVLGLIIVTTAVYLSFVNWKAAVIVLLFLIVANTANNGRNAQ